jgi:molecular chaperone GrpE
MTDDEIEAVLGEFRLWLRDQGSGVRGQESGVSGQESGEAFDPLVLVGEFTALRHEVKLLTKATRAQNELLATALDRFAPADDDQPRDEDLRALLSAAVELVDVMDRAVESAVGVATEWAEPPRPWWNPFGRTDPRWTQTRDRIAGLGKGLELAANRLGAGLRRMGLEPVEAIGRPFDPETMEVLDVATDTQQPPGTVVAVIRPGYFWQGKVLRYAQVRVAK